MRICMYMVQVSASHFDMCICLHARVIVVRDVRDTTGDVTVR